MGRWFSLLVRVPALVFGGLLLSACSLVGGGGDVVGYPDLDVGADSVESYKLAPERELFLHVFEPAHTPEGGAGAVLFFHGGGFATTRVEQFIHQAKALAAEGISGVLVEYRVTAEGTTRADAIADGSDALAVVRGNAERFGIDPNRVALAGSSAGGDLAVEASGGSDALVLFNPAVGGSDADLVGGQPTIVFHSRADTVIAFESAEQFCDRVANCELVAFDEGDHGFFNDEPALTETTTAMIGFLRSLGW